MSNMRNTFVVMFFLSFVFGFAQNNSTVVKKNPKDGEELDYVQIFTSVEVQASPPGGMDAFRKYLVSSFNLPEVSQTTIATVIVKFVVWNDGTIKNIQIIKETPENLGLGKEAIRVLNNAAKWIPAEINGKKVCQYFSLPIKLEIPATEKKQPIQEIKKEEAPIASENSITNPEKQAEPIGGMSKFYSQLSSSIQVPEIDIDGTYKTRVKFLVNQDGSLSDFQIIEEKPFNIGLGQSVIRYLKSIEKWIPAEQNGRKVRTYFVLPVTTVIESEPEPELKKD